MSGGKLSLGIASAATAFTSEVNSALKARTLAASDLGDGFTVFSLNFGEAYQENIFEGKELVATQLTGADADYVQLQEVGADKIGERMLTSVWIQLSTRSLGKRMYLAINSQKTQLGWIMVIIQY